MKWFDFVSIEDNKDFIIKTFKAFNLVYGEDFYEVQHWDGTLAMIIRRKKNSITQIFKIVVDQDLECAKILMRNMVNNLSKKEEYHIVKDENGKPILFYGYDIWYDILKFLFKK